MNVTHFLNTASFIDMVMMADDTISYLRTLCRSK